MEKYVGKKTNPVCFLLRQESQIQKSATPEGLPPPTQKKSDWSHLKALEEDSILFIRWESQDNLENFQNEL